ncbi:MAG: sugar phosphate isomerase/epimerase family protein [Planctomycetota bacterium]|nr:sugar phosphate isomerase/epimerase family protein [Planctomycetota bacterium]
MAKLIASQSEPTSERLNRRACLGASIAGLMAATLQARPCPLKKTEECATEQAQATADSSIRLGFGTYGMRSLSPLDAIRVTSAIGYQGIELCLLQGWPTSLAEMSLGDRQDLRQALSDHRLEVPSLLESLPCLRGKLTHRSNLDRLKAAAEFGKGLAQGTSPVVQSIVGGKAENWENSKQQLVTELGDWAQIGQDMGVFICFKPHASHLVGLPEQALWILDQINSPFLRIVYDYSHYFLEGIDLKESLNRLLSVSPYIQVKDSAGTRAKHRYLLPGDGKTDYKLYFQELHRLNYRGFVNVEVSSMIHRLEGYDPLATAKICYQRLQPLLQEVISR